MGFNRKDLEGDDDNNEFNFEDLEGDGLNNFAFDDADLNMDDADDQGFGFEGEDMPAMDDDAQQQRGVSRPFLIIAILMIVLFIGGLVALVVIAGNKGPTPIQLTSTAITLLNATTEALGFATSTAAAEVAFAQTQTAAAPTPTLPPTDTPAPSDTPTPDIQPTLDATQEAANALATQNARELEMTMQAATLTALAPTATPGLSINDVQLTATALAILIGPGQGGGGDGTPTAEGGLIITPFGPSPTPDALPQTGFFEDLAAGNANVAMMAMIGIALVGVIFVSRYFRTVNK